MTVLRAVLVRYQTEVAVAARRWMLVSWLHRHGIARTVQSSCSTAHPNVRYLMEARWWTPHWLLLWAAQQHFQRSYSSMVSTMYLDRVQPEPVAVDGTQRWVLHWRPTAR